MKNIYINSNGKVNKDIKISLISDLHIRDTTEYLRILKLIKKIKKVNPDYILILGDICDKAKFDKNTLDMIHDILSKLSNIATTYSVLGNHDLMKINSDNWKEFRGMTKPMLFDYAYCITCHKSQGSEFDKVLVFNEYMKSTDHKRWLYTAATRAKKKLIIVVDA